MRVAIFGANSQIAKDLIRSFSSDLNFSLNLFSRRPLEMAAWLKVEEIFQPYLSEDYSNFLKYGEEFDALINFVGSGDPAKTFLMGKNIFDVTKYYDDIAMDYIKCHPKCKYIFISSGAVFGSSFKEPIDEYSQASIALNNPQTQDWYANAKLYAELSHRAYEGLPIVDVRVFNYFSSFQDLSSRFLITEILKSIKENTLLHTTPQNITRDFLHPDDFFNLIKCILKSSPVNNVIDCFTREPTDKLSLLEFFARDYGLNFQFSKESSVINATGNKENYYSLSKEAAKFGYEPCYTSLEGIAIEVKKIL
jgi:nucleoside-diphosphate-sugar epimerase